MLFVDCPARSRIFLTPQYSIKRPGSGLKIKLLLLTMIMLLLPRYAAADTPSVTLKVQGVSEDIQAAIEASLSLSRWKNQPRLTTDLIERFHKKAPQEIRSVMEPFGYYKSRIESQLILEKEVWKATYKIVPGPPILLSEIKVKITGPGSGDPVFKRWEENYPLKQNDILNHKIYEDAKKTLLRHASERGYFESKFVISEIRIDLENYNAKIRLEFETGPRDFFGEVKFIESYFDPHLLNRFVPFKPGDPYQVSALLDLQRNLSNTNYFQNVEVRPLLKSIDNHMVPIEVRLQRRKRMRYSIGAGYVTDEGPRVKLSAERRWVNQSGHMAAFDARGSGIGKSFEGRYTIPLSKPASEALNFIFGIETQDVDVANRETSSIALNYVKKPGKWFRTVALLYEQERFEVGDERGFSKLLVPKIVYHRVSADNRFRPQKGWRVDLDILGSHKSLGSDVSFLQTQLRGKYIFTPWADGRIITRVHIGLSWTSEFSEVPVSYRFFTGGDYSVRGYKYLSLGPTDEDGNVIGGKFLFTGSLEYEHNITGQFSLVLFYDAGNASNTILIPIKHGAGLGARWHLPFGNLWFGAASALSDRGRPWRLHLTVGFDL